MTDIIFSTLKDEYSIFITIIALICFIWAIYNKIKFLCLEKASEMVAEAEGRADLNGAEKFALVLTWINNDLPKVFKNTLFQTVVENLIEFAYKTSFCYMSEYVKRKTGYDMSDLIEEINNKIEENKKETSVD